MFRILCRNIPAHPKAVKYNVAAGGDVCILFLCADEIFLIIIFFVAFINCNMSDNSVFDV